MYTHTHIHIYTHTYIYATIALDLRNVCEDIQKHTHTHINITCVHLLIHRNIHACISAYKKVGTYTRNIETYLPACAHTCICITWIRTHTHTHTHTHIHTDTHTHTHTHTRTCTHMRTTYTHTIERCCHKRMLRGE